VGNTHAAISSGQYVYVRQHGSLSEGLYKATTNIAANGTLSGSNLTAVSGGGLNSVYSTLSDQIGTLNSKITNKVLLKRKTVTNVAVTNGDFTIPFSDIEDGCKIVSVTNSSGWKCIWGYYSATNAILGSLCSVTNGNLTVAGDGNRNFDVYYYT
jgi:hypothetical protein